MRWVTVLLAIALSLSIAPLSNAQVKDCKHPCGRVCCP